MKNDKLWANIKIREELESWWGVEGGIDEDGINYVLNIIDQLDEPEVLSKEWIDGHITDGHNVSLGDKVVYADELDGLLVPKQEEADRAHKVEEGPLYRVSAADMRSGFWFLCKDNDGDIMIGTNKDYYRAGWDALKLTEQEIKDYDERYWPFAEPVEVG